MIYEWDPTKAEDNLKGHKVSFDEAASVFTDPFALTFDDPEHSFYEQRYITIGTSARQRILLLSHADRADDHVRIISARKATPREKYAYQESRK